MYNKNRSRINQLNVTNENKNGLLRNVSRNFCVMCICCGVSIIKKAIVRQKTLVFIRKKVNNTQRNIYNKKSKYKLQIFKHIKTAKIFR